MKNTFLGLFIAAALLGLGACAENSGNTAKSNAPANSAANNAMKSNAAAPENTSAANTGGDSNPTVGGAPMLKTKDIIDNAVNSKDHTTLVAAVKAAGLVDTLKGA